MSTPKWEIGLTKIIVTLDSEASGNYQICDQEEKGEEGA
jgi:hypothetical protein